jgi:His/Glu/Gln/Arg/opine family amino acid ABC transporter permease subunit
MIISIPQIACQDFLCKDKATLVSVLGSRIRIAFALGLAFLCLTAQTHAQNGLSQIKQRGVLIFATDPTYPPFEYMDKDKMIGFDVDIGNEIAKDLGLKSKWIGLEWAGVLGSLESGKCDLAMAGITITEERKGKGYVFSRPYFLSGQEIVRRKGDTRISKPQDLIDKKVAVQQETTGQFAIAKLGVPKEHMVKFDQVQDGLMDVRNGRSDATVGDLPALKSMIQKGFPELELVGEPFVKESLGIVAWKNDPDIIGLVNRSLSQIMVDGRYAAIYKKWFNEPLTTEIVGELENRKKQGSPVKELPLSEFATVQAKPRVGGSAFTFRWDILANAAPQLVKGAELTLILTFMSLGIGIPSGLILALLRISPVKVLNWISMVYVEIIRGTPLLMQIYVIYFVLPAIGIELSSFVAGVLALSLNAAAYISEIFRAGIESIDSGQMEAARSLGMDYPQAMTNVILPQTLRRVLPPLTNEAVALLKDSSLVSVVALAELMRVGKEIATNGGSPTTVYLGVAVFYLVMTLPLTWLVRRLENKWQPISRPRDGARRLKKVAA